MSTRKTHPLEWVSLGFAIVALSYTEWSLAVAAGAHPLVAMAVPGALDTYAVRAMRVRRHVPVVVLAMVGVNALSYLVHAGVLLMTWPVLIVVSAIAPLTFWAVHVLGHGEAVSDMAEARKRTLWGVPQDAELGVPLDADTFDAHALSAPGVSDVVLERVPDTEHAVSLPDFRQARARRHTDPVPDAHAPWCLCLTCSPPEPHRERALTCPCPDGDEPCPEHDDKEHTGTATVLTLPLPGGFEHVSITPGARDKAEIFRADYEEHARELGEPTLRWTKDTCSCSTDTARMILRVWRGES